MGAFQPWHLIVILVIVLLVFGPGKLPELGKALGDGMRELKRATSEGDHGSTGAAATAAPRTPVQPLAGPSAATVPAAPSTSLAPRTCPSCRASVPAADRFCGTCGASAVAVQPLHAA